MPIERAAWRSVASWADLTRQMQRLVDVFVGSDRYAVLPVNASGALALTWPRTLVEGDATAGAVALLLPPAHTVPGFRVEVVKLGAHALTVNGTAVATAAAWISTGALWRQVA
jgi:hypothetical protein